MLQTTDLWSSLSHFSHGKGQCFRNRGGSSILDQKYYVWRFGLEKIWNFSKWRLAGPPPPSRLYKSISEKNGSQSKRECENVWLYCILHLWKVAWQPSEQFFPFIPGTVPVFENFIESTWSPYLCLLNSLMCQLPNSKSLRGVEPQRPKMPILFIYR